jgi:hypothetical protein
MPGRPDVASGYAVIAIRWPLNIDVPVVGLDDLIQMKLARGRPVDLEDVAALTDPQIDSEA